jgi:2-haloacid dehalogenase
MSVSRRSLLGLAAASLAGHVLAATIKLPNEKPSTQIKAIAFDALAIFDTRPVFTLVDQLFPTCGAELSNEWRTRQFEYTWLRVAARQYEHFWHVTDDALTYAANKVNGHLTPQQRSVLMDAYLKLKPWPDVPAVLSELRAARYRLAFLSNFTPRMLDGCIRTSELEGVFELIISSDQAKTFKPDPAAYQLAMDALREKRNEILFVAFAGWDAVGAKCFGYPTFWLNRLNLPHEELGAAPDGSGRTLYEFLKYLYMERKQTS